MKINALLTLLVFFVFTAFSDAPLNPTGTYKFNTKTKLYNSKQPRISGEIRVKQIEPHQITLCLYYGLAAPTYNSGSFVDTLAFNDGTATYTTSDDSTCQLHFTFTPNQVSVRQLPLSEENPFSCGFGYGVNASGVYHKTSSAVPIIKDLSAD